MKACVCPDPELHRQLAAADGREPDPRYCYRPEETVAVPRAVLEQVREALLTDDPVTTRAALAALDGVLKP